MRAAAWCGWALIAVGCARQPGAERGVAGEKAAGEAGCRPAALASARALPGWQAPETCSWRGAGAPGSLVRDEAELAAVLDCKGGPSGFDFRAGALAVASHALSPATVGIDALDDGTSVTWVSRMREPCPGDPLPMAITQTRAVVVAAGASRAFKQDSCKVPRRCER